MNNLNTRTQSQPSKGVHTIGWIATVLVIVGALNWLMVGVFRVDVVASVFGDMSPLSRIIYVLVGLCGLYQIYFARLLAREAHGEVIPPTAARTTT